MAFLYRLSIIVAFLVLPTLLVNAQEDNGDPCESAALHEFDFWLGEWQVFDKETGKLIAYDRIEKDFGNCVVLQRWTSLDDTFRAESTPSRMRGMSLSGHNGNEWVQIWADNMGGTVVLRGGLIKVRWYSSPKRPRMGFTTVTHTRRKVMVRSTPLAQPLRKERMSGPKIGISSTSPTASLYKVV